MHHVVGVTHGGKREPRARARPIDSLRMSRPPSPLPDALGDLSLLEQRIASRVALIDLHGAEADAQAMLALAAQTKKSADRARALSALSLVLNRQERNAEATVAAEQALAAAQRSRQPLLVAVALLRAATASFQREPEAAARQAELAVTAFERLHQPSLQGQALRVLGQVRMGQADRPEHLALIEHAVALLRQAGDKGHLSRALNTLVMGTPDMAQRLRELKLALQAALEAGDRHHEVAARHNLALTYSRLGHNRRALRLMQQEVTLRGPWLRGLGRLSVLSTVAFLQGLLGDRAGLDDTLAALREALAQLGPGEQDPVAIAHTVAVCETRAAGASQAAIAAAWRRAARAMPAGYWLTLLVWAVASYAGRLAGQHRQALRDGALAARLLRQRSGRPGGGLFSDAYVLWQHAAALAANGLATAALAGAEAAYERLLLEMRSLSDAGLRRSVTHAPEGHAELVQGFVAMARQAGLPRERYTTHLASAHELHETVERLVDTGLRLNALVAAAELPEFLLDEVAELLGARRVLVVLDSADGEQVAGAHLPAGETAAALHAAIAPWLAQARQDRSARLRHGPDGANGADELDQRSCLVAPLMVGQQLLGFLYADIDGLFGRFHDSDRDVLATLAAQAAVALTNLRTTKGLEHTVAERTALERRASELALINSIQQGMASKLDFHAIVRLAGDRLREVFDTGAVHIYWMNTATGLMTPLYAYEHGKPATSGLEPFHMAPSHPLTMRHLALLPTVLNSVAAQRQMWPGASMPVPQPQSLIKVPISTGGRFLGVIGVEDYAREDVFDTPAVELITTVAAGLGTALENARLFDETQRLLKETEARNAELAVINSTQQGLARQLDFQGARWGSGWPCS